MQTTTVRSSVSGMISPKQRVMAALAAVLMLAAAPGCGEIVTYTPVVAGTAAAAAGGWWAVQQARGAHLLADQESVKLELLQSDLAAKKPARATKDRPSGD